MTTLVAGRGYTGARIVQRLGEAEAIGLGRSVPEPGCRVDLDRDEGLPFELPSDYRVVYTVPPAAAAGEDPRLGRFLGWLDPRPRRFVYLSTTGVYGDRGGATVDEGTPPDPASERGRRRLAAETLLGRFADRHDVDLVILRVPGIYGPGRLGTERIREGAPVLAERDANPGNRIHVDDLVTCCVHALSADTPPGVYNVGDGDERSSTWFTFEVARQLGLPEPPAVSRETAERTFPASRLSFLAESRRVDTRKMREVLGVVPRFRSAEDGIRASLDEENSETP